jgi:nicotinate-nucleotide pyrophosphorylase (carboxylating)
MQSRSLFSSLPYQATLEADLPQQVRAALAEDIGTGDITAGLIPAHTLGNARIITREHAILCGQAWVEEVFRQQDPAVHIRWETTEGSAVTPDQCLFTLAGPLRSLLTGERAALNFLQCLSGTATLSRRYAQLVRHTGVKLLDTRKTLPGLRTAQKYAVSVGGCYNHRIGLYDAFLIKENHIAACGSIAIAIRTARQQAPHKPVEVEVENLDELDQALTAAADIIMLDNFSIADMALAVKTVAGRCKLEASGGINDDNLVAIAETGVDYISIGSLTKHVRAIDLSMRVL